MSRDDDDHAQRRVSVNSRWSQSWRRNGRLRLDEGAECFPRPLCVTWRSVNTARRCINGANMLPGIRSYAAVIFYCISGISANHSRRWWCKARPRRNVTTTRHETSRNIPHSRAFVRQATGPVPAMKSEATAIFAPQDGRRKITVSFDGRRFCVPKFRH